jgi:hypothetical protein
MVVNAFWIPVVAIVGGFAYIIVKTMANARVRELEIRERIAMIERGLVPAPEVDPRGFDRAMSRLESRERSYGSGRHRRAGVTLMGVGFGLMVLIGFTTGEPDVAVGVGGFLVVIGLAFFINSLIETDDRRGAAPPWAAPASSTTPPPTPPHQD